MFERYRGADAAIEHVANIGHWVEADHGDGDRHRQGAATPNAKTWENPRKDGDLKLFTPWLMKGSGASRARGMSVRSRFFDTGAQPDCDIRRCQGGHAPRVTLPGARAK